MKEKQNMDRLESLDCLHQAYVAFRNELAKRNAVATVFRSDTDDASATRNGVFHFFVSSDSPRQRCSSASQYRSFVISIMCAASAKQLRDRPPARAWRSLRRA
jgi:hypothetical protein